MFLNIKKQKKHQKNPQPGNYLTEYCRRDISPNGVQATQHTRGRIFLVLPMPL